MIRPESAIFLMTGSREGGAHLRVGTTRTPEFPQQLRTGEASAPFRSRAGQILLHKSQNVTRTIQAGIRGSPINRGNLTKRHSERNYVRHTETFTHFRRKGKRLFPSLRSDSPKEWFRAVLFSTKGVDSMP